MKLFFDDDVQVKEAGIDEAGRGCLSGRMYAAAVILPRQFPDEKYKEIKDSKKLTKKKRSELRDYIEKHAVAFSVEYSEPEEIDKINILNATLKTMHKCIKNLKVKPNLILVDGNRWNTYTDDDGEVIINQLIKGGDNLYYSIAAASILAKVYHDEYVLDLCKKEADLDKYGWQANMCYGTKKHIEAIKEFGITKHHRKTFGICKNYN